MLENETYAGLPAERVTRRLTVTPLVPNGNQASTGDEWNQLSFRLPGAQYDGEMLSNQTNEFAPTDYLVGLVSLLALTFILAITLRD